MTTHSGDYGHYYIAPLKRANVIVRTSDVRLTRLLERKLNAGRVVEFEDSNMVVSAYITGWSCPVDSMMEFTGRLTGAPFMKEEQKVAAKKTKLKKFYVAHPKIGQPGDMWSKDTLAEAVSHAEELLEKEGRDVYYVVKIVKRVRRPKPKAIVENV